MLNVMRHRGPDDRGEEKIACDNGSVLHLGHLRLSIIDLSPLGHQPMANGQKSIWISTNGEIYNFRELRPELERLGHTFKSQSDTEVLLKAYESWGVHCLERLRGMFAFGIFDASRQILFIARDRLGIKPIYYYSGDDRFVFASEVRAVQSSCISTGKINPTGLYHYLSFGRLQSPETILDPIRELKPGHYIIVDIRTSKIVEKEYWNPLIAVSSTVSSDIKEQIRECLLESIRLRMVSDVPVGTFLSGGIDSSVISSLTSYLFDFKVKTLSVIFKEKAYDESAYAARIAREFRTDHTVIPLDEAGLLEILPKAVAAMDQPTVDGINTYIISRSARELGLKVVLSGLGGDELFGGYDSFHTLPKLLDLEKLLSALPRPLRSLTSHLVQTFFPASDKHTKLAHFASGRLNGGHLYFLFRALFCQDQIERLLADKTLAHETMRQHLEATQSLMARVESLDTINRISYLELTHYMANMLLRDTDVMSMAHGLEARVPLIDHKLVELLFAIPGERKIDPRTPKHLLIDSLPKKLPDEVVYRKKMGFTLPFETWMRTRLKSEMENVLLTPVPALRGLLDETAVRTVWSDFLDHKTTWSRPWSLYILKKWADQNLRG